MLNSLGSLTSSPQRMSLFAQLVGMLGAIALAWAVFAGVLSLVSWWGVILVTMGLGVAVYVRGQSAQRRQMWLDMGRCGACGYDLCGLPTSVCPECGRDSAVDEPTWRRLRREHEAKFGRSADALTAGVDLDDAAVRVLLAKARARELDG